jgi:hypothetical protein
MSQQSASAAEELMDAIWIVIQNYILKYEYIPVGRNSVASRYGLDGPEIESW